MGAGHPTDGVHLTFRTFTGIWDRDSTSESGRSNTNATATSSPRIGHSITSSKSSATEAVMVFLVTYTLRPKRGNTQLVQELQKSPNWAHHMDDTWLITSYEPASQIWARVAPYLNTTDSIFIVEITKDVDYFGWLPPVAWTWLNNMKASGWMDLPNPARPAS